MLRKFFTYNLYLLITLHFYSCYEETAVPVTADFDVDFVDADESAPVQLRISNTSRGAAIFKWEFEGGSPAHSSNEDPGAISYNSWGNYTITLWASNADGSQDSIAKSVYVYDAIHVQFGTETIISEYPPVEVSLNNNTIGEDLRYIWTFENGTPDTSTKKHPENVVFDTPGEHSIILKAFNDFESFSEQKTIYVAPDLNTDFDWMVDFKDDDYQAPVTLTMTNNSISATSFYWTFEGGTPQNSTEEAPVVVFENPGIYQISLQTDNGKKTQEVSKEVQIHQNTNLRTFNDIELAINNTHNTNVKGAFFSTTLRKVFKANEVNAQNGSEIDIVFFGLNSDFSFNKFVSPTATHTNGFKAIPNARHTKFINALENCNCSAQLSNEAFDELNDDGLLKTLTIIETNNGLLPFDQSVVPRIVLFETEDGRIGAIKIKDFVVDGNASYVVVDIKVQKEERE